MDMFNLENDLPDELISSNASWPLPDNIGNPKPPAQGPGPGGSLQNGIENAAGDGANALRQQIQLNHMLQQQVNYYCRIMLKINFSINLFDINCKLFLKFEMFLIFSLSKKITTKVF